MTEETAQRIATARKVARDIEARVTQGDAGRAWMNMPLLTRAMLVMVALDPQRCDEDTARRPWASYTDEERLRLGSTARGLRRQLAEAEALR